MYPLFHPLLSLIPGQESHVCALNLYYIQLVHFLCVSLTENNHLVCASSFTHLPSAKLISLDKFPLKSHWSWLFGVRDYSRETILEWPTLQDWPSRFRAILTITSSKSMFPSKSGNIDERMLGNDNSRWLRVRNSWTIENRGIVVEVRGGTIAVLWGWLEICFGLGSIRNNTSLCYKFLHWFYSPLQKAQWKTTDCPKTSSS